LSHDTCVVATTGGFTSEGLALEAKALQLSSLTQGQALEIGAIAQAIGLERKLPIAIEVRMKDWIVFTHRCLDQTRKMIGGLVAKLAW
jgi:uncharacterized protein (UPF0303 family)